MLPGFSWSPQVHCTAATGLTQRVGRGRVSQKRVPGPRNSKQGLGEGRSCGVKVGELTRQRARLEHKGKSEARGRERDRESTGGGCRNRQGLEAGFVAQCLRSRGGGCSCSLMATETGRPQSSPGRDGAERGVGRELLRGQHLHEGFLWVWGAEEE